MDVIFLRVSAVAVVSISAEARRPEKTNRNENGRSIEQGNHSEEGLTREIDLSCGIEQRDATSFRRGQVRG
jgi:hypothetical protein